MIKAIFFDIDGTLVSFKTHRIPENTRRSLDRLREKGILTFVATGRQLSAVTHLGDWTPDGYVTVNGGLCKVGDEVVHRRTIDRGDLNVLLDRLEKEKFFPFIFLHGGGNCVNYADGNVAETLGLVDMRMPPVIPVSAMRDLEVFQIMGFFGKEDEAGVMALLPHCEATRWTPLFTDIIPAGTDKWVGISKVMERFGIGPEETMAFGDGANDMNMLRNAGIGIAMGNADEEVRKEADWVTAPVDDDGITKALEHFGIL